MWNEEEAVDALSMSDDRFELLLDDTEGGVVDVNNPLVELPFEDVSKLKRFLEVHTGMKGNSIKELMNLVSHLEPSDLYNYERKCKDLVG